MRKKIWLSIFISHKSGSDQIQICLDFFRIFNRLELGVDLGNYVRRLEN